MITIKCDKCGKQTSVNFDNCQHCGQSISNHPLPVRYYGDKEPQITSAPESVEVIKGVKAYVPIPPPPPITPDDNSEDKWAEEVFSCLDNLLWMIEQKKWKSSIHIQNDICNKLKHIPESFVRDIVKGCGSYPSISRYYIKNS